MTCEKVHSRLAGYLDDAVATATRPEERNELRKHLESCASCRAELQRYRKMSVLLSRMPRAVPPVDLAIRIKVAAAQAQNTWDWPSRRQRFKVRLELLMENSFRPLTVPATGGLFSAFLIFVLVLHMMLPGITVQADPNDVPLGLLRPAELISLADYPGGITPEVLHPDVALEQDLRIDVTVDAQGEMTKYEILNGEDTPQVRHHLDQILIFSRFRPMLSFGRPTAGGHVVLSFSSVYVRG
jgi:anti-sigma factor RsiW